MCSARTTAGAEATVQALARGAVDFVEKPTFEALTSGAATREMSQKVRNASVARVRGHRRQGTTHSPALPGRPGGNGAGSITPASPASKIYERTSISKINALAQQSSAELIAIGTSTGGPPALELVLRALPANFPFGLVIVQHMPAGFTNLLATHLNNGCEITVREAKDREPITPGVALIAPGDNHMRVVRSGSGFAVALDSKSPTVNGHRPSVDVLFESVSQSARGRVVAVLMTGMGSDGAEGMGNLAKAGAVTIAQTPDSCICHGMPKSAIERGYARAIVPLDEIASSIMACVTKPMSDYNK
jgi:two-component system chemotaxis response regulator CheB